MTEADDPLLSALADAHRRALDRDRDDAHKLAAYAAGTLGPDELAELERRAKQDPAFADMLESMRPLDAASVDQIASRAQGAPAAQVVSLSSRRRVLGITTSVLAAAAAAALWISRGPHGPLPLPEYGMEWSGSAADTRGDHTPESVARVTSTTRLQLVFRPAVAVKEPLQAKVVLVDGQGPRWIEVMPQWSDSGAVKIVVFGNKLVMNGTNGAPTSATLFVVVGRAASVPSEAAKVPTAANGPDLKVWALPVQLLAGE